MRCHLPGQGGILQRTRKSKAPVLECAGKQENGTPVQKIDINKIEVANMQQYADVSILYQLAVALTLKAQNYSGLIPVAFFAWPGNFSPVFIINATNGLQPYYKFKKYYTVRRWPVFCLILMSVNNSAYRMDI